jgi:hypothetical protein
MYRRTVILAAAIMLLAASSARAEERPFHSFSTVTFSQEHSILSGEGKPIKFTPAAGFGAVSCTVNWSGTDAIGEAKIITIFAEYKACTDSFGRTVHWRMNECDYKFRTTAKLAVDEYRGEMDISCPAGKEIEVEVTSGGAKVCLAKMPSQPGKVPVFYKDNTNAPWDVLVETEIKNLEGTVAGGFLNCGVAPGAFVFGELSGNVTLKGFDTGGVQLDFYVE